LITQPPVDRHEARAVSDALADLLSVCSLTEAHEFVVTELSRLGGAVAGFVEKERGVCTLAWPVAV
jgi:hypothetical protein